MNKSDTKYSNFKENIDVSQMKGEEETKIIDVRRPEKAVWNPTIIMFVSIFSILPGAIWFAINYARLNHHRKVQRIWMLIASTLLFYILPSVLPWIFSNRITFIVGIVISILYNRDQAQWYKKHVMSGGKKASLLIPLMLCISNIAFLVWVLFDGGFFETL